VVVYRDAHIDDDELIALSSTLGEVVVAPTGEHER
jgi:alpha-ketoglutarate-dependent taurine dioxygenase